VAGRSTRTGRLHAEPAAPADSWRALLGQLVHALLRAGFDRLPIKLVDRTIATCALVALICPLLLWISWSKAGFLIITGTAAAAVGIIYLLVWLYPEDPF